MPPLASWGARLGALLLDILMFELIPLGLLVTGEAQVVSKSNDALDSCASGGSCTTHVPGSAYLLLLVGSLLSLAAGLYLVYREGSTGQTPGKRIAGIRLLREYDGSTLGFGLALGRRLLHILDSLPCYLGFLWPLWDEKRQTFADKCVHTVVIKDPN